MGSARSPSNTSCFGFGFFYRNTPVLFLTQFVFYPLFTHRASLNSSSKRDPLIQVQSSLVYSKCVTVFDFQNCVWAIKVDANFKEYRQINCLESFSCENTLHKIYATELVQSIREHLESVCQSESSEIIRTRKYRA